MVFAVEQTAETLERLGARQIEASFPELKAAFDIWAAMLTEVMEQGYDHVLGDGNPMSVHQGTNPFTIRWENQNLASSFGVWCGQKSSKVFDKRRPQLIENGEAFKTEAHGGFG